jgi:hypothetical protein
MTDWAAAAHRDVPGSGGTGTVGCGLAGPLDGPVPGNVGIAVSERLVCPGRRAALALPSQSARAHRLCFQSFHGPDVELQQDIHAINIRLIYHILRRGMWTIPGFSRMHRRGWRFPQVKGPPWVQPGSRIPSISTAHAQDQCCYAQVIHIFVHSQQVSSPLAGLAAAAGQRASACGGTATGRTRGSEPGADEIVQEPSRGRSPLPWVWDRGRHSCGCRRAGPRRRRSCRAESSKAPHV